MTKCKFCSSEFEQKDYRQSYCSRSCSNKHSPRRKKSRSCKECSKPIYSNRTYCSKECNYKRFIDLNSCTLKDLEIKCSKYPSAKWNMVRAAARRLLISLNRVKCEVCGWDKFFEAAHIKPISSFDSSAKVSEVNSPSNLMSLCPNCHWEHDH